MFVIVFSSSCLFPFLSFWVPSFFHFFTSFNYSCSVHRISILDFSVPPFFFFLTLLLLSLIFSLLFFLYCILSTCILFLFSSVCPLPFPISMFYVILSFLPSILIPLSYFFLPFLKCSSFFSFITLHNVFLFSSFYSL